MTVIYLSDVRDWLKDLITADSYYVGKLNANALRAVGVYQRGEVPAPEYALGGKHMSYSVKPISILLHWTKNAEETEQAAYELHNKLRAVSPCTVGGAQVLFIILPHNEPIDVGTGENGIFERVIELDIYYNYESEE